MPKAEWKRQNLWLRMALVAPTKGGKTAGALAVATHLFGGQLPVTLIDTEYERAKLYAEVFKIDHYRTITGSFAPDVYIQEIEAAEAENPGGVLIIDSATHEWNNTGGILEIVDKGKGGNWKEGTPAHNKFTNRIAHCQMHVITCVRSKMKYEWQDEDGKKVQPRRLGIGPEQRDNFLYDYDVEGDIDQQSHLCSFLHRSEPGRPAPLNGVVLSLIPRNEEGELDPSAPNPVADILTKWLSEGEPMPEPPAPPEAATDLDIENLRGLLTQEGFAADVIDEKFAAQRSKNRGVMSVEYVVEQTEKSLKRLQAKAQEEQPKPEPATT